MGADGFGRYRRGFGRHRGGPRHDGSDCSSPSLAVGVYNYFMNKIDRFQVEMSNSASELLDYFIKRRGAQRTTARAS